MSERVNPATLRHIRVGRKVSKKELAFWLGTSPERIASFEAGTATPTIPQLRRMALAFKVPLYTFRKSLPPNLDPIPDDFRRRDPNQADLTPAGLAKLWAAEKTADFTNELLAALGNEAPRLSRLPTSKAEASAKPEELRRSVDNWIDKHGALLSKESTASLSFSRYLRLYVERHGCLIAYDDAPSTDFLGFYKRFNPKTPLAFVNRKAGSQKAALFTLAHEWAHYLVDAEGISDPWVAQNEIERSCNQFAAKFLAPEYEIKSYIDKVWTPQMSAEELAGRLSRSSLLSFRASAIRLQELGYLKRPQVKSFFQRVPEHVQFDNETDPAPVRSGGNVYSAAGRRLAEVGTFACAVASIAIKKRIIDEMDVAQALRISPGLQPFVFGMAEQRFEVEDT